MTVVIINNCDFFKDSWIKVEKYILFLLKFSWISSPDLKSAKFLSGKITASIPCRKIKRHEVESRAYFTKFRNGRTGAIVAAS